MSAEELHELEARLWQTASRFDHAFMDAVLDEDFVEFGRSGRRYDKATLPMDPIEIDARLTDYAATPLADDVWLATYVSELGGERANRSSLWLRTPSGWRLRFHQGTPTS